ncbi:MAG: DNA primase [Holosporaceae bacterium]|jgi:DNA primase|nr:DNA primase [Holosporaceae bacterium]
MQKDFLDFLKSKASILEVVSRRVKLTRSGKDWFGLCPFHSEKTGSFKVNPDNGSYYCFGCGAHGDVINFVMEFEKISFPEAAEYIANMYGIAMPKKNDGYVDPNLKIYIALDVIKKWFVSQLHENIGENARRYLESRKISSQSMEKFQLGFAADNKKLLFQLKKEGFSADELLKTGIFFKSQYKNELSNRFDGRLMFPIFDSSGRCVGFGGRIIEKTDAAKYINSPESDVFIKSEHLYGYSIAKRSKPENIILTEGYLDVIAMHQAGFGGAVAPLGTAISESQMRLCWKISDTPVIALDGDAAGLKASYRWVDKILPAICPGKSFSFARLPAEADPDSLIFHNQTEILGKSIREAVPLSEWLWDGAFLLYPSETPEQKAAVVKMILEKADLIRDMSVKNFYIADIKSREKNLYRKKFIPQQNIINIMPAIAVKEKIEKIIIVTLLNHPYIIDRIVEHLVKLDFSNSSMQELRNKILDYYDMYYLKDEQEKYAAQIGVLAQKLEDAKSVEMHAPFCSKNATDDDALKGWYAICNRYSSDPALKADLQNAASRLEFSFSYDDWQRLKALKKETLLNNIKKQGET